MIPRLALALALLAWQSPDDPPIALHGAACIHVVIVNGATPDAAPVARAAAWWSERAPQAHFRAVITTEARQIDGLHANDPRIYDAFGGVAGWQQAARAANAARAAAQGCATAWALFVVPTAEQGWAHIYGPAALVATGGAIPLEAQIAHEIGHIYGALDQTRAAGVPCTARSGVLQAETQNSDQPGCLLREDSIMKNPIYAYPRGLVDRYALAQMGVPYTLFVPWVKQQRATIPP